MYFEDLHIGDRFESRVATMERDRMVAFAAEFDPQPQHLDEAAPASAPFGGLIASGWHTAAVTMRLQTEALFSRFDGALGAQVEQLAWRRPVRPGDELRVIVEILALRPSRSRPGQGVATLRTTTIDAEGRPVLEMTAAVMLPRRPPAM